MKKHIFAFLLIFLSLTIQSQEKKNPRQKISFNSNWKFILANDVKFIASDFDDSNWRVLELPHDWSIEQKASKENSGRNAWLPGGIGWYRKKFTLPQESIDKHVEIQFDGVYRHSKIWVNGVYVGVQYDGYTSFYFDITEFLRPPGEENTIAVKVDNSIQPNCRWYSGSGIYRNTWLTITDKIHVKNWGTNITTPFVSASKATVAVKTTLENFKTENDVVLKSVVYNSKKEIVKQVESKIRITPLKTEIVNQSFDLLNPNLWSVLNPNLYSLETQVWVRGKKVDTYPSTFGIRSIKFDGEKGFFLNGKNTKLKGVCLHHEAGSLGAAVPIQVWERRLKVLKEIGCNAIRTAHNPMAPEFMDLCDAIGFLVMDEFVDKWSIDESLVKNRKKKNSFFNPRGFGDPFFELEWQKNYKETIRRDRNHPSVIIWSVGNENHSPGTVSQNVGLKKYISHVKSVDDTRPVISGMERGRDIPYQQKVKDILESCSYMDLIALNYGEQWCAEIKKQNPGKAYVSTESYRYFNSSLEKRFANIERSPWLDVLDNDYNTGLFLWSGIDYLGESRKWPKFGSNSSLVDFAGFRREISYLYEAFWSEEPMVRIAVYEGDADDFSNSGRWGVPPVKETWNLDKEKSYDLVTYTNCESVNLYLNNKFIGNKQLKDFENWIVKWKKIKYQPGILKAKGVVKGKEVCEFVLKTTKRPYKLSIVNKVNTVKKGDVLQLEVQVLDKKDRLVNNAEIDFEVILKGGAEILALENGDNYNVETFTNKKASTTQKGKCLVILKVNSAEEDIVLNLTSKSVKLDSIVIKPIKK